LLLAQVAATASDAAPFVDELDDYAIDVADEEDRSWFRAALVREPDNPVDSAPSPSTRPASVSLAISAEPTLPSTDQSSTQRRSAASTR
jgi:hypothetical protein